MPDEPSLREQAREAIRSGQLPAQRASRVFGGQGSETPCALCGEIVSRDQLEIEIEANRHGINPGLDRYHFHVRCYAIWELERTKVERTGEPPPLSI